MALRASGLPQERSQHQGRRENLTFCIERDVPRGHRPEPRDPPLARGARRGPYYPWADGARWPHASRAATRSTLQEGPADLRRVRVRLAPAPHSRASRLCGAKSRRRSALGNRPLAAAVSADHSGHADRVRVASHWLPRDSNDPREERICSFFQGAALQRTRPHRSEFGADVELRAALDDAREQAVLPLVV